MNDLHVEIIAGESGDYRIRIHADPDAPSPLSADAGMGVLLSFNTRHRGYDPAAIERALAGNPDAVPLSYYEHGLCLWRVAGELPAGAGCPWDSVTFAGLWLPDADTLAAARHYGGRTRQLFMRRQARQACESYTAWCNGEVYGYMLERLSACACCGSTKAEPIDACWGIYGLEECRTRAMAALQDELLALSPETR